MTLRTQDLAYQQLITSTDYHRYPSPLSLPPPSLPRNPSPCSLSGPATPSPLHPQANTVHKTGSFPSLVAQPYHHRRRRRRRRCRRRCRRISSCHEVQAPRFNGRAVAVRPSFLHAAAQLSSASRTFSALHAPEDELFAGLACMRSFVFMHARVIAVCNGTGLTVSPCPSVSGL